MDKKQHAGPVPPRNMTVNYSQYNPLNILHKSGIFTTAKHLYQQFKRSIQSYKKLIQCFIFFFAIYLADWALLMKLMLTLDSFCLSAVFSFAITAEILQQFELRGY